MATPILLINEDYVKQYTHLNSSIEAQYLYPAINVAQDIHIQQILGTDLLEVVKIDTQAGTISGVYLTLKDDYIKPALVWWTVYELIPNMYVKVDNAGIVVRTPVDVAQISPQDLSRELSRAKDKAEFYTQRLNNYVCENQSSFPEYSTNTDGQLWSNDQNYKGGLYIPGRRRNYGRNFRYL